MLILSAAVAMAACAHRASPPETFASEQSVAAGVAGVVRDGRSQSPLPNALVVLRGSPEQDPQETMTNSRGAYAFDGLEPGTYTVEVMYGQAALTQVVTHDGDTKVQANFAVDPDQLAI